MYWNPRQDFYPGGANSRNKKEFFLKDIFPDSLTKYQPSLSEGV